MSDTPETTDEPRDPYEPAENGGDGPDETEPPEIYMASTPTGEVILTLSREAQSLTFTPDQAKSLAGDLLNLSRDAKRQREADG